MRRSARCPSLASPACSLVALLAVSVPAIAQIPNNSAVVSRFQGGQTTSPLGGLAVIDLASPRVVYEITGLSPDLTGSSRGGGEIEGVASVLVDGRSGQVIAGEHARPNDRAEIHVLTLAGTAVVSDVAYEIGSSSTQSGSWIDQMAWFGEDIVFTVQGTGLTSGAMANHLLGVLRPQVGPPGTAGTITPVPLSPLPTGFINALAVDERRGVAYLGMYENRTLSQIYSVPIPGDGVTPVAATLVGAVPAGILNLALDRQGQLWAGCVYGPEPLYQIDTTQTPAPVTAVRVGINDVNGLTVDNVTGDLLLMDSAARRMYRLRADGAWVFNSSVTGTPTGVAIRQALDTYGRPAPGQGRPEWLLTPNPGGAPSVGSASFSLTAEAPSAAAFGVVGLSLGEGSTPLPGLGVDLLLDTGTLVLVPGRLSGGQSTIALPIPNTASLVDASVYAQTFYSVASGWTASSGLRITFVQ